MFIWFIKWNQLGPHDHLFFILWGDESKTEKHPGHDV